MAEIGLERPWVLKGPRKTCATKHDEHLPQSSAEILGQSVGGTTYCHDERHAPLGFRVILTRPQSRGFRELVRSSGSECLCCWGRFADPG